MQRMFLCMVRVKLRKFAMWFFLSWSAGHLDEHKSNLSNLFTMKYSYLSKLVLFCLWLQPFCAYKSESLHKYAHAFFLLVPFSLCILVAVCKCLWCLLSSAIDCWNEQCVCFTIYLKYKISRSPFVHLPVKYRETVCNCSC